MSPETFERLKKMGITFDDDFENFLVKPLEKHREKNQKSKQDVIKKLVLEKTEQEKKVKDKKAINLIITLERNGKEQFDDTINSVWKVFHFSSMADIELIKNLNNSYYYKNIALIHHGNVFSQNNFNNENKIILNTYIFKEIKKAISKIGKIPDVLDEEYFDKIVNECKYISLTNRLTGESIKGLNEKQIKSFFSLKLLISQISNDGSFFSIACDEADDINFLPEFADFTDKNIKIYGNRNFSSIQTSRTHPDLLVKGFGSILNSFLTDSNSWKDFSGWIYYDTKTKKQIITKKDLWLSGYNKKKPYELIFRKKQLSNEQEDKEKYAQLYFSKKVKKEYIQRIKVVGYEKWKIGVETTYPEFK